MSEESSEIENSMIEDEALAEEHRPAIPEELVEVPIQWNQEAEEVSVYCSYDNFRIPMPLQPHTTKTKKGRTKKIFKGTLNLPPGPHLIRYQVDGDWRCDDSRELVCSRGFEYNSLIVHSKEESDDDHEKEENRDFPGGNTAPATASPSLAASRLEASSDSSDAEAAARKKKKKKET